VLKKAIQSFRLRLGQAAPAIPQLRPSAEREPTSRKREPSRSAEGLKLHADTGRSMDGAVLKEILKKR
jgi:hypothetical protein